MDYKIRLIDIDEPGRGDSIAALLNTTFKLNMPWETIRANTYYDNSIAGSPPSFYVGAFTREAIVGFAAFKSHDFLYNGKVINCFHHCFVATDASMRGKGIFPKILAYGKTHMQQISRPGFVYGVPNKHSGPVLRKLNYKYYGPFLKVNVINQPLLFNQAFANWRTSDVLYSDAGFFQNDYQIIDAKEKAKPGSLIVFEDLGNLIWGRALVRKTGPVSLRYFSVGGMIVNKPHFFKDTVRKLCRQHRVHFVRFIFHNTSIYKKLFRNPQVAPHVEPLMLDEVAARTSDKTIFNFMPGIKDHF